jgi:DNA-binding PadR family transcriptional regulator
MEMGAREITDGSVLPMRSAINWAVLGLVIERPGHGYDVLQRFESAYTGVIELTSHSQINGALKALEQRGMIERLRPDDPNPDAQARPRACYRPTTTGLRDYEQWLNSFSPRGADAPGVFARQVAVLPTATALGVIERYEQACLNETSMIRVARAQESAGGRAAVGRAGDQSLEAQLISEEKHLALAAKIQWARYARSRIEALRASERESHS